MADDALNSGPMKMTLGQAIDQVISALVPFKAPDQQTILKAVYAHLNISAPAEAAPVSRVQEDPAPERSAAVLPSRAGGGEYAGMDIRTFKAHTATDRKEVVRVHAWVRLVLCDLLEVPPE